MKSQCTFHFSFSRWKRIWYQCTPLPMMQNYDFNDSKVDYHLFKSHSDHFHNPNESAHHPPSLTLQTFKTAQTKSWKIFFLSILRMEMYSSSSSSSSRKCINDFDFDFEIGSESKTNKTTLFLKLYYSNGEEIIFYIQTKMMLLN